MAADLTRPPVIIGGCGRSGTSLLLAVLSAHPALLAIPRETEAFCPTAWEAQPDLEAPFMPELMEEALSRLDRPPTARRWVEKSPKNILFFGRLIDHFGPEVRLLNIVRDGRDVVTSFHPTRRREKPWVGPERWVGDVSAGEPFDRHPSVLVVRYEDLVLEFEPTVRRICGFLGEEVHPHLLDWHSHATVRRHVAWSGRVSRLHPESVGKWRRPENRKWVEPLLALDQAHRLLAHYGYLE
jgi:hypothetical protein